MGTVLYHKNKADAEEINRGDYTLFKYSVNKQEGLSFIQIHCKGLHPMKKVENKIRIYKVESGSGNFYLMKDGQEIKYPVDQTSIIIIYKDDVYRYEGEMSLFEINNIE